MRLSRRFAAPIAAALAAMLLAACGTTQVAPSRTPPTSVPPPAPTVDVAGRDAYNEAMCPVFSSILELDPRLASMRGTGAAGGDMSEHATEIGAVSDQLLSVLNALEAVPEWSSGADLRFRLITALHGIRARLLRIADDPAASTAADDMANLPFISSDAMDIAMQDAVQGGLVCAVTP